MKHEPKTKNAIRARILNKHRIKSGKQILEELRWEKMSTAVGNALVQLLRGRNALRDAYADHLKKNAPEKKKPAMTFALDGRLVGDIGELIGAEIFPLDLLGTKSKRIDAETTKSPSRGVQIKATFGKDGLSIKHGGDYFIGLQLNDQGQFRVIYNGPAKPVMDYLKAPKSDGQLGRVNAGKRLEPLSLEAWAVLNLAVPQKNQIPRR